MKRTRNVAPVLQIVEEIPQTYYPCLYPAAYIYQLARFGDLMSCGSEDIFKMHPVSCTNTHHDVADLLNHGMVKNTKVYMS